MNDNKNKKQDKRTSFPAKGENGDTSERIAKRLARAGVASRREAESLIAAGRVKLNGRVLDTPAVNVRAGDRIEIDGEPIPEIERTRLFLFHKPAGVVTTNRDPEGRRTVFDVLPEGLPRLITVGRLDINTEGLLLLTNDGGLARVLELPQTGWLRRYRVRVHGEVDEAALAGLKEGIAVDGVFYGAIEAALDRRQGTNAWLTVGLREGKNREVKNVMAALGLEVTRLIRVSYGPFQLADLEEGQVRELRGRMLRDQLGPRLIEEAGANFDAPIVTPFSSKGESAPTEKAEPRAAGKDRPRPARAERGPAREEAGGLVRNRRRDRTEKRDDALSRLSTSAPAGRGPKRDDRRGREDRPREPEVRRSRTSNVWMAPGARPQPAREPGQPEKVVRVARKPGDRKADHDAAAKRPRPGRAERAAGKDVADRPRREWKPRPEGEERPKREFKPRSSDGPKRDWKARPPRPGKAERAAAAVGEAPQREYRPRPKPRDGDRQPADRPFRRKSPSSGPSGHLLPDGEKRSGATDRDREAPGSRTSSPRRGEGGRAERRPGEGAGSGRSQTRAAFKTKPGASSRKEGKPDRPRGKTPRNGAGKPRRPRDE